MNRLFDSIYDGRRVLVTGHTGFKGSWLSLWLKAMGAKVYGYARSPITDPNHHDLIDAVDRGFLGDIADGATLQEVFAEVKPEIVFHLAAQPLVRESYRNPVETYRSNVMGTLQVCEAVRQTESVRAFVAITTDKVYENHEWEWGYREVDRLGGYDPYSSSKACAEVLLHSYRNSYFPVAGYGKTHSVLMSSVRAGNVIGGGDWSDDRLIPDLMKACASGESVVIRSPEATRPWQHVLDCLSGYLLVGQRLLQRDTTSASAFNFGPADEDALAVREVVSRVGKHWPVFKYEFRPDPSNPHEANYLKLDCSRAANGLHWQPVWRCDQAFEKTVGWYRSFYEDNAVNSLIDLEAYVEDARAGDAVWA